jgi:hypothetical protein
MTLHSRANWSPREDRRITLLWLGLFLAFVVVGFGSDLTNYFHESPPVPKIVHIHAVITTIWLLILTTQVLLVEVDNVKLHRKLGWFAAGWAAVLVFFAAWGELSWEANNLHTPGLTPAFLSVSLGGLICFALLMLWGILLRKNHAAHRRVILLANISIVTAGFLRLNSNLLHLNPTTPVGSFFYYYSGTLFILLLMFLWDWWKGRLMRQFVLGSCFILLAHVLSVVLLYNKSWEMFTHTWLEAWAKFAL